MKHNHQQNERFLKQFQQQVQQQINEICYNVVDSYAKDIVNRYKTELSRASLSNEATKETTQFNIPINITVNSWIEKGGGATASIEIETESKVASMVLTAAWHGTGMHINPEIVSYIEKITGTPFTSTFPDIADEDGQVDPDKLNPLYFNPTNADIKFRDAMLSETKSQKIMIIVKDKK